MYIVPSLLTVKLVGLSNLVESAWFFMAFFDNRLNVIDHEHRLKQRIEMENL